MIIGRAQELAILKKAMLSKRAELGIVYGRRRVGKSFLLESLITRKQDLYFEAIKDLKQKEQVHHFLNQFSKQTKKKIKLVNTWIEAFEIITPYLSRGQHYVVFDELSWMAGERQQLVNIIKFYWDRFWKKNTNLTLVLCGSIANFMVKHVVHSSALHNRKTFEIKLDPLSAEEALGFFKNKRSLFEISKFLMVYGGVPKYLEQIDINDSLSKNLNQLCFSKNGFFVNEFETIFKEQFKVFKKYERIIQSLSNGPLTKEEIAKYIGMKSGGGLSTYLLHLEKADFIVRRGSIGWNGKNPAKTVKYYLWDEWLCFYFSYMKPNLAKIQSNTRYNLVDSILGKSFEIYLGYQFEKFCIKNIEAILRHAGIPLSEVIQVGPYFKQGSRIKKISGVQVDLVVVRRGFVVTLFECKFYSEPVDTQVIDDMQRKIQKLHIPKKYTVEKILIAANGVMPRVEAESYFHKIIDLSFIFKS